MQTNQKGSCQKENKAISFRQTYDKQSTVLGEKEPPGEVALICVGVFGVWEILDEEPNPKTLLLGCSSS